MNQAQIKQQHTFIGCVDDLRNYLKRLPKDVDGVDETYQVTRYHNTATGEKWIEISPAD